MILISINSNTILTIKHKHHIHHHQCNVSDELCFLEDPLTNSAMWQLLGNTSHYTSQLCVMLAVINIIIINISIIIIKDIVIIHVQHMYQPQRRNTYCQHMSIVLMYQQFWYFPILWWIFLQKLVWLIIYSQLTTDQGSCIYCISDVLRVVPSDYIFLILLVIALPPTHRPHSVHFLFC